VTYIIHVSDINIWAFLAHDSML